MLAFPVWRTVDGRIVFHAAINIHRAGLPLQVCIRRVLTNKNTHVIILAQSDQLFRLLCAHFVLDKFKVFAIHYLMCAVSRDIFLAIAIRLRIYVHT